MLGMKKVSCQEKTCQWKPKTQKRRSILKIKNTESKHKRESNDCADMPNNKTLDDESKDEHTSLQKTMESKTKSTRKKFNFKTKKTMDNKCKHNSYDEDKEWNNDASEDESKHKAISPKQTNKAKPQNTENKNKSKTKMTSDNKCEYQRIDENNTPQEEFITRTKHACCDTAEHEKNFIEMYNAKSKSIHANISLFDEERCHKILETLENRKTMSKEEFKAYTESLGNTLAPSVGSIRK